MEERDDDLPSTHLHLSFSACSTGQNLTFRFARLPVSGTRIGDTMKLLAIRMAVSGLDEDGMLRSHRHNRLNFCSLSPVLGQLR